MIEVKLMKLIVKQGFMPEQSSGMKPCFRVLRLRTLRHIQFKARCDAIDREA